MGLLKRLFGGVDDRGPQTAEAPREREAKHPGGGFKSSGEVIEVLLGRMYKWKEPGGWATFTATDGVRQVIVEVADDVLNVLHEELAPDLIKAAGLEFTGSVGLYRVPGADAGMMADVIAVVLKTHYGMPSGYSVRGVVQS